MSGMLGSSGKKINDLHSLITFFGNPEKVQNQINEYAKAVDEHKAIIKESKRIQDQTELAKKEHEDHALELSLREQELLDKGNQLRDLSNQLLEKKKQLDKAWKDLDIEHEHVDALYLDAKHESEKIIDLANKKALEIEVSQREISSRILNEALAKDEVSSKNAKLINAHLLEVERKLEELKHREEAILKREEAIAGFVKQHLS